MGASAFTIALRAVRAAHDKLPDTVFDIFLGHLRDELRGDGLGVLRDKIGREAPGGQHFLIEVGGPPFDGVAIWFDERTGWERSYAEHCVGLAIARRRVAIETELANLGYEVVPEDYPIESDERRGGRREALFFRDPRGRVGLASTTAVEWQVPYEAEAVAFADLSEATQAIVTAVLEHGECGCPYCEKSYTPSPAAAGYRAVLVGEQTCDHGELVVDPAGRPVLMMEARTSTRGDASLVVACDGRGWPRIPVPPNAPKTRMFPRVDALDSAGNRFTEDDHGYSIATPDGSPAVPFAHERARSFAVHPTRPETAWYWSGSSLFLIEPAAATPSAAPDAFAMLPLEAATPLHALRRFAALRRRKRNAEAVVVGAMVASGGTRAERQGVANAFLEMHEHARALAMFRALLEPDPEAGDHERHGLLIGLGRGLVASRKPSEAEAAFREAIARCDRDRSGQPYDADIELAELLVDRGRREAALAVLDELVPWSARTRHHWKRMYGDVEVLALTKGMRLAHDDERRLLATKARTLRELARYDELLALARDMTSITPRLPPIAWGFAYLQAGHAAFALGRYQQALADYDVALKVSKIGVQNYRGNALAALGQSTKARNAYKKVLDGCPATSSDAYLRMHRAYACLAVGDLPGAEAAIAISEEGADARLLRARVDIIKGEHETALAGLRELRAGNPADPEVAFYFAVALAATGDNRAARDALDTVMRHRYFGTLAEREPTLGTLLTAAP